MAGRSGPKLTEEQIADILTSREENTILAARYGRSPSLISLIRVGKNYARVRPDLPRQARGRQFCSSCREWRDGECRFGFPDPLEEGLQFATDCLNYERAGPAPRRPQSCAGR